MLNPWDKIADPCAALGHAVPPQMPARCGRRDPEGEAAASLGMAQTRARAGSLARSSQLRSRSRRQRCEVCGRGNPERSRGCRASVKGGERYKAPGDRAAPLLPAWFSAVPRRRSHGHLSRAQRGAAGRGPWLHFRAGQRRRRRNRGWAGPDRTRPPPGPFGPPRASFRGQPGSTMITSAGEPAARGGVVRRGFAESGP